MTERPLDCDPEQGGRQEGSPRVDGGRRKDHSRGRRRNGRRGRGRESAPRPPMGWAVFSFCVTRSRWHSSPACSSFFLRQIGSFSCVSHCFTLRLPPSPLGDALSFSPSLPFCSVSKWKANSVALSEAGSSAGHFSPDRVPRRGRRR